MKYKNIVWFGSFIIILTFLSGCDTSSTNKQSETSPSVQEETELHFSVSDYQAKLNEDRIPVLDCADQYESDINQVIGSQFENINFENCVFSDMPDTSGLMVMEASEHGITAQESWDTLEQWLEAIGKSDEVDMNEEARIVTSEMEWDEEQEPPYCYPSLAEYMELFSAQASGSGAVINTDICHLQISTDGIYSMSDGKMTEYLGITAHVVNEALGNYADDVVTTGKISEMAGEEYELINCTLSIQDGADMVEIYLEAGTPFACEDNVTIDVYQVNVFRLGDVYGYDYMTRRLYNNVPFAYQDSGTYHIYGNTSPQSDTKHVYVVDDSGVSGYYGTNESEPLEILFSDDQMLSLVQAVQIVSENLASMIYVDVKSAELVYYPVSYEYGDDIVDETEKIILPCWEFRGINTAKNEYICLYVDVFTGELHYYTQDIEE